MTLNTLIKFANMARCTERNGKGILYGIGNRTFLCPQCKLCEIDILRLAPFLEKEDNLNEYKDLLRMEDAARRA